MTASEALARVHADLAPRGPYRYPPTAELMVYPQVAVVRRKGARGQDATAFAPEVRGATLVYHVHTQLENGVQETAHTDYLLDAQTGAILKKWDALHTSASRGEGRTQYSGTVRLDTASTPKGFELRDLTRGKGGPFKNNVITNLDHGTDGGGTVYLSDRDTWGDGANYIGSDTSTTGATGQTAAADAAYGVQVAWDMYRHVFHRQGIDGKGTATYSRVHYSTSYDNAFWDDTCFCMTYGDGSDFKSLEAMDVTGHELSHGVCANSAKLLYLGESGGLNEANSDILGTMVEFYARGGGYEAGAATVPAEGGDWTMGEALGPALRFLYKPSKDGRSPDAWSSDLGDQDVHYSSGPMNRCFYFLSQGASASAGDYHTPLLPAGMVGLGNDTAARIWYRALTVYLTSGSGYAEARTAAISAVKDLYGPGGLAEQAVWNAFHGINVGPAWGGPASPALTPAITHPAANLRVPSGKALAFAGTAKARTPEATFTCVWTFGDGATAKGPTATHTFTNTGDADAVYEVAFKVTDGAGLVATASRTVTVTPEPVPGDDLIRNGGFEQGTSGWAGTTDVIGAFKEAPPYAGTRNARFGGKAVDDAQVLYQTVAIPAAATAVGLSFHLHVAGVNLLGLPTDSLEIQVLDAKGGLLKSVATFTNLDTHRGYSRQKYDLSAYAGQTVRLAFKATVNWLLPASFSLDQVRLMAS